ncbi:MAG TPA: hypothetical protein VM869_07495, partial [Enhygromyxa sp.]|nr:hypothetical protein [Enhygromyxa sp.]
LELTPPVHAEPLRSSDACPWGRVAIVRLLPGERGNLLELDPDRIEAATVIPPEDFGDAIEPTVWVPGRSLSRYRSGTVLSSGQPPTIVGLALELPAGDALSFAPIDLPLDADGRPRELDVLVTLAGTWTDAGAELRVSADDHEIGVISPPAMRRGSWIGPPLRWQPRTDRATLRVELLTELLTQQGHVELRDVALFVRSSGVPSEALD